MLVVEYVRYESFPAAVAVFGHAVGEVPTAWPSLTSQRPQPAGGLGLQGLTGTSNSGSKVFLTPSALRSASRALLVLYSVFAVSKAALAVL